MLQKIRNKTTGKRKHLIDAVILSHPDYHRRLQNHTGSADLCFIHRCSETSENNKKITANRALAGLMKSPESYFTLPPVGTFTLP
ncbi:hypothetical protein XBJ2_920050 [Xenorhabdus bovienii str. Jollieti]|nr:hypothetical protein XBJ2_920050 [Xenorhabdus bovienii str. Jollieti]